MNTRIDVDQARLRPHAFERPTSRRTAARQRPQPAAPARPADRQAEWDAVDEASLQSFPASDAPGWI